MSSQSAQYGTSSSAASSYHHEEHYPHKKHYDDCNSNISPWGAYLIWFIVLIVLIWILRCFNISWFSAVVFSLVVAWIVLAAVYPVKYRHGKYEYCNADALLGIITVFTVILVIIWFIWKVFTDRECNTEVVHEMSENGVVEGDVNYSYQASVDTPKGRTVASGSGSVHKSSNLGSLAPSSSSGTPVSQMGGTRSPSGPF